MAAAAPARLAAAFRLSGVRGPWFRLLSALGYRRLVITRLDFDTPRPDRPMPFPAECLFLTAADIADYARLRPGDASLARARFLRGDRCFAVRTHEGLVYAIWLATGATMYLEFLGRSLKLEPGEVGIYDAYVRPDLRRQGLARAGHWALRQTLTDAGHSATVAAAFPENVPGVRLQVTGEYKPVGLLRTIRLGPIGIHLGRRRDVRA